MKLYLQCPARPVLRSCPKQPSAIDGPSGLLGLATHRTPRTEFQGCVLRRRGAAGCSPGRTEQPGFDAGDLLKEALSTNSRLARSGSFRGSWPPAWIASSTRGASGIPRWTFAFMGPHTTSPGKEQDLPGDASLRQMGALILGRAPASVWQTSQRASSSYLSQIVPF